uniref:Uncharacterized protein n=1 Tax=Physcomitrium patens TaxID=3218 RepID=A0A2K1IQA6_PHYPA|nr:hypothetical protein PHYPA_025585 [Physcomitrium patens]
MQRPEVQIEWWFPHGEEAQTSLQSAASMAYKQSHASHCSKITQWTNHPRTAYADPSADFQFPSLLSYSFHQALTTETTPEQTVGTPLAGPIPTAVSASRWWCSVGKKETFAREFESFRTARGSHAIRDRQVALECHVADTFDMYVSTLVL